MVIPVSHTGSLFAKTISSGKSPGNHDRKRKVHASLL
jgi:hypothetical protein